MRTTSKRAILFCGSAIAGLLSATSAYATGQTGQAEQASTNTSTPASDIVVTAQKRAERLQTVPVPVTSISADTLSSTNQAELSSYYQKIPGFSLTMLGDTGAPVLVIRGITTGGYTNPTVGVVVDDIPFGTSTYSGGGLQAPDFDPSVLSRIEVLRGPQGTLYGASSIGGLLKYVTADPSTKAVNGRIEAGITGVENGDGVGYHVRGSLNVPISETLAVIVSGSQREDAGYIDNPISGEKGINRSRSASARVSLLWRPSSNFSIKLSALGQNSRRDGEDSAFQSPGFADLQQNYLAGTGTYASDFRAYSATLNGNIGSATLTSLTGYSTNLFYSSYDTTPSLGTYTNRFFGVTSTRQLNNYNTDKFSQELRLSLPVTSHIDWLVGAFYTKENTTQVSNNQAVNVATSASLGSAYLMQVNPTYSEAALFTDITYKFTDRFDVQIGGRLSRLRESSGTLQQSGPFVPIFFGLTPPATTQAFKSGETALTYLFTPRFKISESLMAYARLASGFRPGGPNTSLTAANLGLPNQYKSDKTNNYEIGVKGSTLKGLISFDTSIYYITWKDIQIQLKDPVNLQVYYTNAGNAVSKGVEASVEVRPWTGMVASAWVAYDDAKITDAPTLGYLTIHNGDQLPYSSPWSGSVSLDQSFPLGDRITGSLGGTLSFVDSRTGRYFTGPLPRQVFPAYNQLDLRASLRKDTWMLTAFVNNLNDARGVLRGGRDAAGGFPQAFTYIKPRNFGLSVAKTF